MDLSTNYMGLRLRTPLVAGAGPFSQRFEGVRRLEDAGASAVVLYSLFEEQLTYDRGALLDFLSQGSSYAETVTQFGGRGRISQSPVDYLEAVNQASASCDIPIIASLNGSAHLRWTHFARLLEQAGAAALELNFYEVPTDVDVDANTLEARYVETIASIRKQVKIPVAIKLSPFFTNMTAAIRAFADAGADGFVLFNRFYQPDIDLDTLRVRPHLTPSAPHDIRLSLRWISILRAQIDASYIATGGVHSADDALKLLLVGADAVQMCSALLRHGLEHVRTVESGLRIWLASRGESSISDIKGRLTPQRTGDGGPDMSAFERAQYMKTLESYAPDIDL
ncbi:MAG: dihydroorotate dehydrogenase-like protein [Myxococcota bacterium]